MTKYRTQPVICLKDVYNIESSSRFSTMRFFNKIDKYIRRWHNKPMMMVTAVNHLATVLHDYFTPMQPTETTKYVTYSIWHFCLHIPCSQEFIWQMYRNSFTRFIIIFFTLLLNSKMHWLDMSIIARQYIHIRYTDVFSYILL